MSSDSTTVSDINQLKTINKEIKRVSDILKDLRSKKGVLEQKIITYLNKTNKSGAKTQNLIVLSKEKISRPTKSKTQKEQDIVKLLENNGIKNASETYKEIINTMKGDEKKTQSLIFKEKK